tara:strand:- start:642 stop:1343 length:702 start_codon:yes stop_codon:yes gene_type:complete
MEIIIDNREQAIKEQLKLENSFENITYDNLLIGDIQIKKIHGENNYQNIVIIERKTINDLKHSLTDGRFSEQKKRICSSDFIIKAYIFEGIVDNDDLQFQNIFKQLIIRIQFKDRIALFLTGNVIETISLIKEIHRKLIKDKKLYTYDKENTTNYIETLHVCKKNNLTPQYCFILQIAQIPGISITTAKNIAQYYSNWQSLLNAVQDEKQFLKSLKNCKFGKKKFLLLKNYIT